MRTRTILLTCLATISLPGSGAAQTADAAFTGSEACRDCHEDIYDSWKGTLMANILQDVREHPEAIVGDFSRPNALVTFDRRDIDFTYGSKLGGHLTVESLAIRKKRWRHRVANA
jgi:hypothetical protein